MHKTSDKIKTHFFRYHQKTFTDKDLHLEQFLSYYTFETLEETIYSPIL